MNVLVGLTITCAIVADAGVLKETIDISPTLNPESANQFTQDFSGDKAPKVDVLHFNHPYPVVQDNEDFDRDFVKDENTDNGEWQAQTEYDRLRHKLLRLKKEAADALEEKNEGNKELEEAMENYQEDMAKAKADVAKKSNE